MKRTALLLAAVASVALSGCATSAINEHQQFLRDYARTATGQSGGWQQTSEARHQAREAAAKLLAEPLSADSAVSIALSHSPAFQTVLAANAAQMAGAVQVGRPSNPMFTFERLARRENGMVDLDIGRMLSVSLLDFITLPTRARVANAMQTQARLAGASAVVEAANAARQAWVRAVATEQTVVYAAQVMEAAEASAELARRMYAVGNFSRLQRARQQAFYADAYIQLKQAQQNALAEREALIRVLGLDDELATKLTLPKRLPELPPQLPAESAVLQSALDQRLDVRMAKAELDGLAARLGLSKTTSVANAFHLAAVRNSETGKPPQKGFELELAIPLFDWGDAPRARAQAEYMAGVSRVAQIGLEGASQLREHYAAARAAHELALHYRHEVVPLRRVIADEMLLKYNGMLVGVFDLLAETRAQIGSVMAAINAERDYWLADAALNASRLGKPVAGIRMSASASIESGSPAH